MTLGEITREEQRKALEKIRKMEGRERERARGIEHRGNLIWVPTLRTSSGVRFGYWRKAGAQKGDRMVIELPRKNKS